MNFNELDNLSKTMNISVEKLFSLSNTSKEIIEYLKLVRYYKDFDYAYIVLRVKNNMFQNGILVQVSPKLVSQDNYFIFGEYFFPVEKKYMVAFMKIFTKDYEEAKKDVYLANQIYGFLSNCEKFNTGILSRKNKKVR